jgi:nucleoside-diphosphate-sugar epimerase
MDLLLLGGTGFLSRTVALEAVSRGHRVTALTRGVSGAPPNGVTAVHADRNAADEMARAARSVKVTAVIDMSGETVAAARIAARELASADSYVYVSSMNAYRNWPPGPVKGEDDPLWDEESDEYGPVKAAGERVLSQAFGDRLLSARAGVIVGPREIGGRLTAWLHRISAGGRIAVPDALDQPMAFVDVRDLASWLVDAAERGMSGPVTATGPYGMTTYGGLLRTCQEAVSATGGPASELVPVTEKTLMEAGVQPWRHLPFWLPEEVARTAWQIETATARRLGLPSRPIEATVADTWEWMRQAGTAAYQAGQAHGLPPELERSLLS